VFLRTIGVSESPWLSRSPLLCSVPWHFLTLTFTWWAAGPPHRPLQAACLVVAEPQPAACLDGSAEADRCRCPAWPSFNELFLQWYASSKVVGCFQPVKRVSSSKLPCFGVLRYPPFLSKWDSLSINESKVSCTKIEMTLTPWGLLRFQM